MIKKTRYMVLMIAIFMQLTGCKAEHALPTTDKNMLMGTWYSKKPVSILGDSYSFKQLTFSKNNVGKYILNMTNANGKSDDFKLDLFYEYKGDKIYYLSNIMAQSLRTHENLSKNELLKECKTMTVLKLSKNQLVVTYYNTPMVLYRK